MYNAKAALHLASKSPYLSAKFHIVRLKHTPCSAARLVHTPYSVFKRAWGLLKPYGPYRVGVVGDVLFRRTLVAPRLPRTAPVLSDRHLNIGCRLGVANPSGLAFSAINRYDFIGAGFTPYSMSCSGPLSYLSRAARLPQDGRRGG